jgi:hypothetical protein
MLDNALLIDSVKNRQKLVERTKQLNCNVVVFEEHKGMKLSFEDSKLFINLKEVS